MTVVAVRPSHRVVEAAFSLPDEFKLNGFSQKHILRKAFRGKVPTAVLDRPKRPYTAPDLKAFFEDGKLTEMAQSFLSRKAIEETGLFDPRMIERFLGKFERKLPAEVGYRDNMIMVFALSAQIAMHQARSPQIHHLDPSKNTVSIVDY